VSVFKRDALLGTVAPLRKIRLVLITSPVASERGIEESHGGMFAIPNNEQYVKENKKNVAKNLFITNRTFFFLHY